MRKLQGGGGQEKTVRKTLDMKLNQLDNLQTGSDFHPKFAHKGENHQIHQSWCHHSN